MSDLLNPYIAGAPVTESSMFFGREDVFRWIENSLAGKFVHHILVIHGQRRVGKTSILKQIPNYLPKTYLPIYLDLQGRTNTTIERFLWWLGREITRAVRQHLVSEKRLELDLPIPEQEAFSRDPDTLVSTFLPGLLPILGEQTLLLTFDEFDTLDQPEVREKLAQPLVAHLRQLFDLPNLNMIFSIGSSGHKLENMQASYTEFFKTALYRKISFLQRTDCLQLVTRPVAGVLEFEPAAVERIYQITSGHPYFTQLTCHELFALCQKTGRRQIGLEQVNSVLNDVIERGTVNLKFVWDEASDLEKWLLSCLAQSDDRCDQKQLEGMLRSQRVRTTEHDITAGLIHLRDKDVLTQDNAFMIELLRIWLQKNRPFDRVREELVEVNPIASRYIEIGDEYRDLGQAQKARESFSQALAIDPANLRAQLSLAALYLEGKDFTQAAAAFERALAIDEEDISARNGLCSANLALGDAALEAGGTGQPDRAMHFYQRVLEISPDHPEARQRLADLHTRLAENALSSGQDELALGEFQLAKELTPEDSRLAKRYAQVLAEKKARLVAEKLELCQLELSRQNYPAAISAIQEAMRLAPEDSSLQTRLDDVKAQAHQARLKAMREQAETLERSELWDQAVQAWEAHLGLLAESPVQPGQLESPLATQEQIHAALERARRYRQIASDYTQAQAAMKDRRYAQAIKLLQGVIAQDASYKSAAQLLVECLKARPKRQIPWGRVAKIAAPAIVVLLLVAGVLASWKWITASLSKWLETRTAAQTTPLSTQAAASSASPTASGAQALLGQGLKICEITNLAGINDQSFNQAAWQGLNLAQEEWGVEIKYRQPTQESDYQANIEQAVVDGCDLIVTVGYEMSEITGEMAAKYPQSRFSMVDSTYDPLPGNVMGQDYKVWEASFLAGYLAAGMTKTGVVGTFGGMSALPVTRYMDGFALGVEFYNQVKGAQVQVLGWDPETQAGLFMGDFTSESKAKEITDSLIKQEADILMPVLGGQPLSAAIDDAHGYEGVLIIGVDTDISRQYPDYSDIILTSVVKQVDRLVFETIKSVVVDNFGGTLTGNLQNGGVSLGYYDQDVFIELGVRGSLPPELKAELAQLNEDILSGVVATTLDDTATSFSGPVRVQIRGRTPDFSDTFDKQDATWELGENAKIEAGKLRIYSSNNQDMVVHGSRLAAQDFALELDFRLDMTTGTSWTGVNFREIIGQEGQSGYHFEIVRNQGEQSKIRWVVSRPTPQGAEEIDQGEDDHFLVGDNRLLLIVRGEKAAVFLNDQPLDYLEDLPLAGELNGFQFKIDQGGGYLSIDTVKLWRLEEQDSPSTILEQLPRWQPDFEDDFSTDKAEWGEGREFQLDTAAQKYVLTLEKECANFASGILTGDEFALQFEAQPITVEGTSDYGVEFRNFDTQDDQLDYRLSFWPSNNQAVLWANRLGSTDDFTMASTTSAELGVNQAVSVLLIALDDTFAFSINGGALKEFKDPQLTTGTNNFYACTDGKLQVAFDNIKFWSLDGKPWIESYITMDELRFTQPVYNYIRAAQPEVGENFTRPQEDWWASDLYPTDIYTVTDGVLELSWSTTGGGPMFGYSKLNGTDFAFHVDFFPQKPENGEQMFGILFRADDIGNQYCLDFQPDYGIWAFEHQRVENGQGNSELLAKGDLKDSIQYGKWARVLLIARGDQFAAYLNGQSLFYLQDARIMQGEKVILKPWSHGPARMRLDNLQFWDLAQLDPDLPVEVQALVGNRPPDLVDDLASLMPGRTPQFSADGALLVPKSVSIGDSAWRGTDHVLKIVLRLKQAASILYAIRTTEYQGGAIGTEYQWIVEPFPGSWNLIQNLNPSANEYTQVASGKMHFILPGEWVTLVVVVTGDTLRIYANGALVVSYQPLIVDGVINHLVAGEDLVVELSQYSFWKLR